MRFLYFGLVLLGLASTSMSQTANQSNPLMDWLQENNQIINMSADDITLALTQIRGDIAYMIQEAIKNKLAVHLDIDPSVLDNPANEEDVGNLMIEKLIDEVNYMLYKMQPNVSDTFQDHMDYFRLNISDKINLLVQNAFNVSMMLIDDYYNDENNEEDTSLMNEKEFLEESLVNLVNSLFDGIDDFFAKGKKIKCKEFLELKKKIYKLKCKMAKILDKINEIEQNADEDDEEADAKIEKLKECYGNSLKKLFGLIDAFFRKNSKNNNKVLKNYKCEYLKLKMKIIRIILRLEEIEDEEEMMNQSNESDESDESDESEESEESEESDEQDEQDTIDEQRTALELQLIATLADLYKGIDQFNKENKDSGCKEFQEIKRVTDQIRNKMLKIIKQIKKIEKDCDEDDKGAQAKIDELKDCFKNLVKKLLFKIECFFKKNSDNKKLADDAKEFRKVKCQLVKIIKQLEALDEMESDDDFEEEIQNWLDSVEEFFESISEKGNKKMNSIKKKVSQFKSKISKLLIDLSEEFYEDDDNEDMFDDDDDEDDDSDDEDMFDDDEDEDFAKDNIKNLISKFICNIEKFFDSNGEMTEFKEKFSELKSKNLKNIMSDDDEDYAVDSDEDDSSEEDESSEEDDEDLEDPMMKLFKKFMDKF